MTFEQVDEEIKTVERERKIIYWSGMVILLGVAIFVPERYAILCFLGAIITTLYEISRKLLNIYYIIRVKFDVIMSILLTISNTLEGKEQK